jgi:hypothetical protein
VFTLLFVEFFESRNHLKCRLPNVSAVQHDTPYDLRLEPWNAFEDSTKQLLAVKHRLACRVEVCAIVFERKSIDAIVEMLGSAFVRLQEPRYDKSEHAWILVLLRSALLVGRLLRSCECIPNKKCRDGRAFRVVLRKDPYDLAMEVLNDIRDFDGIRKRPSSEDFQCHLLELAFGFFDKLGIRSIE